MSKKFIIAVTAVALVGIIFVVGNSARFRATFQASDAPCVNRLMQIDSAKQEWALEHGKTASDVPTWADLYPYLASNFTNTWFTNGQPVCPEGGIYNIERVGVHPTCSIGGPRHSYPD
jgi:hypothetical protein